VDAHPSLANDLATPLPAGPQDINDLATWSPMELAGHLGMATTALHKKANALASLHDTVPRNNSDDYPSGITAS